MADCVGEDEVAVTSGSAWHHFRFKVLLAFQVGEDGALSQRRRVVCFGARDSLNTVHREVAGRARNAKPMWPREFNERVKEGFLSYVYVRRLVVDSAACEAADEPSQWHLPLPEIRLYELAESWLETPDSDFVIQMLFRLEDPRTTGPFDPRLMLAVGRRRSRTVRVVGCIGNFVLFKKNTFLHIGEMPEHGQEQGDDERFALQEERPLSDPGWSCTPPEQERDQPLAPGAAPSDIAATANTTVTAEVADAAGTARAANVTVSAAETGPHHRSSGDKNGDAVVDVAADPSAGTSVNASDAADAVAAPVAENAPAAAHAEVGSLDAAGAPPRSPGGRSAGTHWSPVAARGAAAGGGASVPQA